MSQEDPLLMYSGPRYASETSYYKKRKNEKVQDDVNNNEKLVKKFIEDIFPEFSGGQLSWGKFSGGNFLRGNFPGAFFRTPDLWN